jgi:integrase/recombinase XerD
MIPGGEGANHKGSTMELVPLAMTYARMKTERGDWYGRTTTVYRRHLFSFCASLPPSVAADGTKVARRHVQSWLDHPGHAPAYRRIRLSAVRGFFRWLCLEKGLRKDPTVGVVVPDVPEGPPRAFTPPERLALLSVAERDPRDLLCVSLCFNDAFRRGEVARLLVEDVDWSRQTLSVRGKGYRGNVSRVIPYSQTTGRALHAYLAREPAAAGHVVRSRVTGTGLSPARVGELVAHCITDAGLKFYPGDGRSSHSGRHSVAVDLVEAGVEDRIGMKFLGHRSHANWQRYHRGAVMDLRVVHDLRGE